MKQQMDNKQIVTSFIDLVWNQKRTELLQDYLDSSFVDHSLPKGLSADRSGTEKWIAATSLSFSHRTIILDMLAEGEKVFVRIQMDLVHHGPWRGFEPTGTAISTGGYRLFRLSGGKICEQWAMIDGAKIQEAIAGDVAHCKV